MVFRETHGQDAESHAVDEAAKQNKLFESWAETQILVCLCDKSHVCIGIPVYNFSEAGFLGKRNSSAFATGESNVTSLLLKSQHTKDPDGFYVSDEATFEVPTEPGGTLSK